MKVNDSGLSSRTCLLSSKWGDAAAARLDLGKHISVFKDPDSACIMDSHKNIAWIWKATWNWKKLKRLQDYGKVIIPSSCCALIHASWISNTEIGDRCGSGRLVTFISESLHCIARWFGIFIWQRTQSKVHSVYIYKPNPVQPVSPRMSERWVESAFSRQSPTRLDLEPRPSQWLTCNSGAEQLGTCWKNFIPFSDLN